MEKLGPTGKFPNGKIDDSDDGETNIAMAIDKTRGLLLLHFGIPTLWIGLGIDEIKYLKAKCEEALKQIESEK